MEFSDPEVNETDSDELDEELEHELYSVLHYNILSDEISAQISDKYDIKKNEENEYLISFKKNCVKPESGEENITLTEINIGQDNDAKLGSLQDVIPISDTDGDSDVIFKEGTLDATYISSPSVIEISDSSSDSEMDDVILNIGGVRQLSNIFPNDDDNSEEESKGVKWEEVISPRAWTKSMKEYYNKPCEELKSFDYRKVQEEIKGSCDWHINVADKFPSRKKLKRCTICRQTDHQRKDCPRRFSNCYMCGNPGHNDSYCPFKKCLNCGRKSKVFVAMCQRCEGERLLTCNECNQRGHSKYHCPDVWRRFHSTTKGKLVVKEDSLNEKLMCCNCAQSGHLFENCPKLYWSVYPPTSYLVKKTEEPIPAVRRGKRSWNSVADSNDFDRTPIKPRWNHTVTSTPFNCASTSFTKQYLCKRSWNSVADSNDFDRTPKKPRWNHNVTSTPFNRASTSFQLQSPITPLINKRKRYFQNNSIMDRASRNSLSHNNFKNYSFTSSKQKKRKKKKKKGSDPNKTV